LPAGGPGFSDNDKKDGLERVVNVRRLGQHLPNRRNDQPAMPPHQSGERGLVASDVVTFE
jgi:hypothetical protein